MPATSVAQRKLFAIAEHHPDELYSKNNGLANLSHKTLHDFAATPQKELPQRIPHHAEGRPSMTNTAFQQNERVSGSMPEWMERASAHSQGKPAPNASGGGHWLEGVQIDTPKYRVRKTITGTGAPEMMADGKKGNWMASAFGSNKGGLHRATRTPAGEPIPTSKVRAMAAHGSTHEKRMANAAINANPGRY